MPGAGSVEVLTPPAAGGDAGAHAAAALLLRYCANPRAGFWLRTHGAARAGAASGSSTFDDAIAECLRVTACVRGARDEARWRRALKQAQLPVRMDGLGLTSAARQADASWCGSWALCWARLQRFFPELAGVDPPRRSCHYPEDPLLQGASCADCHDGCDAPRG